MLAAQTPDGNFAGWAKTDGSFTSPKQMVSGFAGAVAFRTAQDAIAWAEAAPRHWQVVNKLMFGAHPLTVPRRMTVTVTEANYAPWYVLHESIKKRLEAGEQVRQVEIKFRALDVVTPLTGCYVVIDSQSYAMLGAIGVCNPEGMVGRTFVLETDDPVDTTLPLRIARVVST